MDITGPSPAHKITHTHVLGLEFRFLCGTHGWGCLNMCAFFRCAALISLQMTNCNGGGQCGTCVVQMDDAEGWDERSEWEANKLMVSILRGER